MRTNSKNIFIIKASLIAAAVAAFLVFVKPAFIWLTPIALILGYLFGKLTCGAHFKRYGVVITLIVFIALNFLHSLVDGIAFLSVTGIAKDFAVYGHELLRQPLLYIMFFAILEPFRMNNYLRIILSFVSITVVWFLGYRLGASLGTVAHAIPEAYLSQGMYFFIGDIVHHVIDEYSHSSKNKRVSSQP